MRTITKIGLVCASLFIAQSANATLGVFDPGLEISPGDCDDFSGSIECLTGNDTGTPGVLAAIDAVYPNLSLNELYRDNVGGSESFSLAGSYQTTYFNSPGDPADALIEYTGGDAVDCSSQDCFALVKDGNQTPAWYLYNITSLWNGTDDLLLSNFWPNQGAISHVSLFGGSSTNVPAPAVIGLLGLGLIGFAARRRLA